MAAITIAKILPIYLIPGIILNSCTKNRLDTKLGCSVSNSHMTIVSQPINFREINMGKYVAYIVCILIILFALEYFRIVDIPYLDLPDIQTTGEEYKEKSEDKMKRRFGD